MNFPAFVAGLLLLGACSRAADRTGAPDSTAAAPRTMSAAVVYRWPGDPFAHQLDALPADAPVCGAAPGPITAAGVGPLGAELTVGQVAARCPTARVGWELGDEAIPEPAAVMRLGTTVVQVIFADTLPSSPLVRIVVWDPAARTSAGVHPGSAVTDVLNAYGAGQLVERECGVDLVFSAHPGLRFPLTLPGEAACEDVPTYLRTGVTGLPRGTRLREIVVYPTRADT